MEEPSKKDKLAKQRTDLANSRTLMSFIRTALMVAATGITFIKLFNDEAILVIIGKILIPLSGILLLVGFVYYFRMKHKIQR